MPINLIKEYPDLLDLIYMSEYQRHQSLLRIFRRDIEDNPGLSFRGKIIRPIKTINGESAMQTLFHHLTTRIEESVDEKHDKKRVFEMDRSQRLHWILYHIEEKKPENIEVFSYTDRIGGNDKNRTYIYDKTEKYVIILEVQRSGRDYYLLTAYYLNEKQGIKQIEKKLKNKLPDIL